MHVSQSCHPKNVVPRVRLGVDHPDLPLDVRNAHRVETSAGEEVVEAAGKALLVEEKMEEEPHDEDTSVEPDGVELEHGEDERYGAELEDAVEEEHGTEAASPPGLLTQGKAMTTSSQEETLDSRVDQEQERTKCCSVLEEGRITVRSTEEDVQLEDVLQVGVEDPVGDLHLRHQGHPVVLAVETGDQADDHQLEGEGDDSECCERNEIEEQPPTLVVVFVALIVLPQLVVPLDEDAEGPEDSGEEEDDEHLDAVDWIRLKTFL